MDVLVSMGMLVEAFETAVTWGRFEGLAVAAVKAALRTVGVWPGMVARRITHVYPDGPVPYYTVIPKARSAAELEQLAAVKRAASDALVANRRTITHHLAVGRDHMPWYTRQRPDLFGESLAAAKARLDPSGVLNPGVLFTPGRRRRPACSCSAGLRVAR